MQDEYWYSIEGARKGPVGVADLQLMLSDGTLNSSTMVWKEGTSEWISITEVVNIPHSNKYQRSIQSETPTVLSADAEQKDFQMLSLPLAGAWRRFFARFIDIYAIVFPVAYASGVILGLFMPGFELWIQRPGSEYAFGWMIFPFVMLAESVVYLIFGNTLGKAILGLKVTTVGGMPISPKQYLKRQISVYFSGFGTGFPIISLVTMVRQSRSIARTRHASYDLGRYNVKAAKLGVWRVTLATLVMGGLFSLNIGLSALDREDKKKLSNSFTWTNEVTGNSITVPAGWSYEPQKNDEQQLVHMFSNPEHGVYVLFAKEDTSRAVGLGEYARAWARAVNDSMSIELPGSSSLAGNRPSLVLSGHMKNDKSQKLRATLIKKDSQMWRVIILTFNGKSPDFDQPVYLQQLLVRSIN